MVMPHSSQENSPDPVMDGIGKHTKYIQPRNVIQQTSAREQWAGQMLSVTKKKCVPFYGFLL